MEHIAVDDACFLDLDVARKNRIRQFVQEPSLVNWRRVRFLLLRDLPPLTLEEAVRTVSVGLPVGDVPDPFTTLRAVRFARS